MDVVFDAGDADVEDNEPDGIVAVAVDQNQPTVAIEDAKHLSQGLYLVRIVMERIAAGNHVEGIILKRQMLGVADHET